MKKLVLCLIIGLCYPVTCLAESAGELSPEQLIEAAIDNWRDNSSYTESSMTIHRPDWERSSSFRGWTQGRKKSLIQFTEPARDQGNASLRVDNSMWSYSPKINRVIKIPASMMAQSWMGSDFSYQDLSRSDDLLINYTHKLLEVIEGESGHKTYKIEAKPKPNAAVVWGKEEISIRDDFVMMEHAFYDQEMKRVKVMKTFEVDKLGGKMYPIRMRMIKLEEDDEWTEVRTKVAKFSINIPERTFTQAFLRNPRF